MSFRDWIKGQLDPGPPDPTWDPKGWDAWHDARGITDYDRMTIRPPEVCETPPPKETTPEEVAAAFPPDLYPNGPRKWHLLDGYGDFIGQADEDPVRKTITVQWKSTLPESARARTRWVDIEALEESLDSHRPSSWTGLHGLQPPIRVRPLFKELDW